MAKLEEFQTLNEAELAAVEGGKSAAYNAGYWISEIIYAATHGTAPIFLPLK